MMDIDISRIETMINKPKYDAIKCKRFPDQNIFCGDVRPERIVISPPPYRYWEHLHADLQAAAPAREKILAPQTT